MADKQPLAPAVRGGTIVYGFDAHISSDPGHIGFIVPMFVRAGAVIPTIELEQYVGERHANGQLNPITLNVYPGQSGRYTMYLDDGVSLLGPSRRRPGGQGEYRETHVSHGWTGNKARRITISRGHDGYTPPEPYFFVGLLHDPGETEGPERAAPEYRREHRSGGPAEAAAAPKIAQIGLRHRRLRRVPQ
jgi:alpha-glucosidase